MKNFQKSIKEEAEKLGFSSETFDGRLVLRDPNQPYTINIEFDHTGSAFAYIYVRTTSWDLPGERTDANELISISLAAFLRIAGISSCHFLDIPHPIEVPSTEVYARYLTLNQPNDSLYPPTEEGLESLVKVLGGSGFFFHFLPHHLDWSIEQNGNEQAAPASYNWQDAENWATEVAAVLGEELDESVQFTSRKNPTWLHYRSIRKKITIYEAPTLASSFKEIVQGESRWEKINGISGEIYTSEKIKNLLPNSKLNQAKKVLNKLDKDNKGNSHIFIPIENIIIACSNKNIIFIEADCSKKKFEIERNKIRERHKKEHELLFQVIEFNWKEKIDDDRFEFFTLDLLNREPSVSWARKVSVSSERDGGRDIISEWKVPMYHSENASENSAPQNITKVLVQSKAYSKPIGKSKVLDIRDTVESFDAHGYLLVTSTYLTSSLTQHLEKERDKGKVLVDWWTRSEIEDRLRQDSHRDLLEKYPDIVTVKT